MPDMPQDKVKKWEGEVEVVLTATFTYTIDETWEARDDTHAAQMVEMELADYVGPAFNDKRFTETWRTIPDA